MSTPTPRTDAALAEDFNNHFVSLGDTNTAKNSRTLETELTAANARIAELEMICGNWLKLTGKLKEERDSLTRQLSEKDSRIAELEKDRDEIEAQLSDARSGWESAEANILDGRRQLSESQAQLASAADEACQTFIPRIASLEAQLASAREDSARLDWLLEFITQNGANGIAKMQWTIKDDEGEIVNEGDTIQEDRLEARFDRSAIDSARGVTSCDRCDGLGVIPAGDLMNLLEQCQKFLVHALCTIPEDQPEYKEASELSKKVNEVAFPEVRKAFAIDSARGVTSPPAASCSMCGESTPSVDCPVCAQDQLVSTPAVAETGEKDAWLPIETAPKDKKAFLTTHRLHGGFQQIGWWNGAHYTTASHQIPDDWVWTALPPPPQGKEKQG